MYIIEPISLSKEEGGGSKEGGAFSIKLYLATSQIKRSVVCNSKISIFTSIKVRTNYRSRGKMDH